MVSVDVHAGVAEVEQTRLGATGLSVSRLALGMMSFGADPRRAWKLGEADAEPIVRLALERGITFFDTADMYAGGASEVLTGRLLRRLTARERVVVATKVFYPTGPGPNDRGLSRRHILAAIDASLERLGMDHVDLYQVHRSDPGTPVEETMEALHDVVKAGKARYLGASSMHAWEFAKAQHVARSNGWTPFVAMQNRHNLLYREEEREMIPLCIDQGVAVLPYSPLARGVPPARVAHAWLQHQPAVTATIVGATRPGHLEDAVAACALELSADELTRLEELYRPHPWDA